MKRPLISRLSLLALAVAAAPFSWSAENASTAETTDTIEEVVAVGKPIAQGNNTTSDAMKNQQSSITSVFAAVDNLPGISISEGDTFGSDDWSTTITARGYSINLSEQQLGITVDGIPNGGSSYGGGSKANRFLDAENMDKVEVFQGAGDIASPSLEALGGTFNFVSADPMTEDNLRVGLTSGDYRARRMYIRADTGEIAPDTFAYLSMSDSYNNRWIGDGSNGHTDRAHYEAKIISHLSNMNLMGRVSFDDTSENNYQGVTLDAFKENNDWDHLTWHWTGDPDIDQNYAETWGTKRENLLAYGSMEYFAADNVTLTVKPYYHQMKGRGDWAPPYQLNTSTGYKYFYVDASGNPIDDTTDCGSNLDCYAYSGDTTRVSSYRHTHYKKQRYGLLTDADITLGMNDIKAGFWYEKSDRPESRDWHKILNSAVYYYYENDPYYTQFKYTYNTDTLMWYVQDTLDFGNLQVNLGAKQYMVDIERTDDLNGTAKVKANSDSDVLPNVGLVYQLSDEMEIHSSYSTNFAAIKDNMLNDGQAAVDNVDGEESDNFDLGLRYNAPGINATLVYYMVDFKNRITQISNSVMDGIDYLNESESSYVNVGGIKSSGIEASLRFNMTDYWELYSSLTLNTSEYSDNVDTALTSGYEIKKGKQVAGSAEEMAVVSLNFDNGRYHSSLSGKYTGGRIGDTANNDHLPDYTLVDFSLGYHKEVDAGLFRAADLSLVINNLLDERYLAGGTEGGYFIGAARTATASLTLDF